VQPGQPHYFGPLGGPVFRYHGPYHFKPPFSVGDSPGHAVKPPSTGTAGSSAGGGHAVQPPQPGADAGNGSTQSTESTESSQDRVVVQATSASPERRVQPLVWLLIPLGLILFAATVAVVFESEDERVVAVATDGKRERAVPVDAVDAPPAGPIVKLGFATRRAVGTVGRGVRRTFRRG